MDNKDKLILLLNKKIKDLEIEKEMFNDIMDHIPGHVYWLNKDNIYIGCNTEHAIHVGLQNRKDIVGKTNFDMPWKNKAIEINNTNNKVMSSGKSFSVIESSIVMGVHTVYLSNKVPLRNKNNEIIGLLGISIDITKQKRLQKQLKLAKLKAEAANQAKSEFIANMSHDIRTPLSGVVGLGSIVEKEVSDPNIKSKIHDMVKSADELLNMINEILDVISMDNISVKNIQSEPFNLVHLVQTIINLEQSSVDLKKIKLLQIIDPNIPQILIGDHKKIHHILLNLVGNAIKFTQKGHVKIDIKLSEILNHEVKLMFQVSDTGIGIPEEELNKIFELFYKITPSYKGLGTGHGIGLHIVKSYTELLGGKIYVESNLNKGSIFSFSLILKVANKNIKPKNIIHTSLIERSASHCNIPSSTSFQKDIISNLTQNAPRILIIEDNDIARTIIKTLIEQVKCIPITAKDGETALILAKTKDFDLIITDIGLPGISGIQFTQKFRDYEQKNNKKTIPIIALTAHAEGKLHDECIKSGINEVIIKPMNGDILNKIFAKFSINTQQSQFNTTTDKQIISNAELDLPESDSELFTIENEIIFDIPAAKKILGESNTSLLMTLMKDTINTIIPQELQHLKIAHDAGKWQTVADISHKLKGGFVSVGLNRAATACKYLERYHKTGKTKLLEKLYQQLLNTLEITSERLLPFLSYEK